MTSMTQPHGKGRIKAFDSLRGMAALGVVFWHYGAHFQAHPFQSLLAPFYSAGYLLVDFFFVLSGYVIAKAYWREGRQRNLGINIWSRVSRLYPLHLLTLVLVAITQCALAALGRPGLLSSNNDAHHFLLNVFMLNGVGLQGGFSFNAPSWSISTEFVVNLLFLVFIACRPAQKLIYLAIFAFGIGFLFLSSGVLLKNDRVFGYLDPQLVRCIIGFSLGVLVQLTLRQEWGWRLIPPAIVNDLLSLTVIIAIAIFLHTQIPHAPVRSYLVIMSFSAVLLVTVLHSGYIKTFFEPPPLVFLGEISYSIYLIHFPLQLLFMLAAAATGTRIAYDNPMVAFLYLGLLIYLSHLTYRRVEIPSQAFLNSKVRTKSAPATAPT